ncbi:hypothetical protein Gotri_005978 [Gossypium trilobum]|uniref:Uncharacterized protein n=1 Tax=Gossypium trilobum TaxID=34281 RepID=A0A7J9EYE4_9ROSI|nr:hypothetical protein [Gossypium trilobum]
MTGLLFQDFVHWFDARMTRRKEDMPLNKKLVMFKAFIN